MAKTEKTDEEDKTGQEGTKKPSSLVPNYHEKSKVSKKDSDNFGEQFKNAFKNTNPKNQGSQKSEMTKQIETKNNISQSIKKSLNMSHEDKNIDTGIWYEKFEF